MTYTDEENMIKDKFSYLWLFISAIMMIFSTGRWSFPVAGWLGLVFVVRFLHTQKPLKGFIIGFLVFFASIAIATKGMILIPSVKLFLSIITAATVISTIPFVLDRLLYNKLKGYTSTFILPLSIVIIEYLRSFNPNSGSFGSFGYSHYYNLPLVQIVSITGIYGISFLMGWFASVVNWIWERNFNWQSIKTGLCVYLSILMAVLIYGGVRLIISDFNTQHIMMAGINSQYKVRPQFVEWFKSKTCPPVERSIRELEEKTATAVLAGAKIVVWNEYTCLIALNDEAAYISAARDIARKHGIYLLISAGIMDKSKEFNNKNKAIFIDPKGEILCEYLKVNLVPGLESPNMKKGSGGVPVIDTPYGKIAIAICYDLDFPSFINKAGASGADIMIAPSSDWPEITPIHTIMAAFMGIENGFTVFRVTGNGYSAATDPMGRVLGGMVYFNSRNHIMLTEVPIHAVITVYSKVGDLFSWLCIMGFILLMGLIIKNR